MPILKKKVAHALSVFQKNAQQNPDSNPEPSTPIQQKPHIQPIQYSKSRPKRQRHSPKSEFSQNRTPQSPLKGSTSSKNIMKNYSRALTSFALSKVALPYLERLLEAHKIQLSEFEYFVKTQKRKVNCIKNLRAILLVEEGDSKQIVSMKTVFKEISIIFMKFFSVNWIYNGKVFDRLVHLKYRFKILRRIKQPLFFTYLEDFAK